METDKLKKIIQLAFMSGWLECEKSILVDQDVLITSVSIKELSDMAVKFAKGIGDDETQKGLF